MNEQFLIARESRSFIKAATVCFIILIACCAAAGDLFAQYKGSPVQKDRLVQVLRSKQLQTSDIVTIINSNGVNFQLTPETKKSLVAAGARPAVIQAVRNNYRGLSNAANRRNKPPTYDGLLSQALQTYKNQRNPRAAISILEKAIAAAPEKPAAYQVLGFIYLYGLNDFAQAEKSMRQSISRGGSAVFRVFHDDNGKFTGVCTGSLYISPTTVRYESDNNVHTFEALTSNVEKIKIDSLSTPTWKTHSIYKMNVRKSKDAGKFRFAPLTGELEESKMVERFVGKNLITNLK